MSFSCVTDVFTQTKGSSPGLDASQVSSSIMLNPLEFLDSQIDKFKKAFKVTLVALGMGMSQVTLG